MVIPCNHERVTGIQNESELRKDPQEEQVSLNLRSVQYTKNITLPPSKIEHINYSYINFH